MRRIMVLLLIGTVSAGVAAEVAKRKDKAKPKVVVKKVVVKKKVKAEAAPKKPQVVGVDAKRQLEFLKKLEGVPKEVKIPHGAKPAWGRAIEWTVNNIDKARGWSLTGFSKAGLSEDFNPWYLKIGFIGGRLAFARETDYVENERYRYYADWERGEYIHNREMILGFHLVVTFCAGGEAPPKKTEAERLLEAAMFYERRGTVRSRKAAVFTYKRIIELYPETEQATCSAEHIKKLESL